ncbi:uncharacterized protein LOC132631439 [Lycium barbarum]|uniref:uncharacterized protein LOC132631439 n=1 Tax=Lycium barbarum TaxID=112863 RepID=UPI00293E9A4F|nr:uncharacterized protein LOC132631439 [Lycium barbarum]
MDVRKITGYKSYFGFHHCKANSNGQIWCFWNNFDKTEIIANNDQQITLNLKNHTIEGGTFATAVYAKCTPEERIDLWESIVDMKNLITGPWCMGGFTGPKFTWCNYRIPIKRIWMRLDRILVNEDWTNIFQTNMVKHLSKTGSDHRPLLLKCHNPQQNHIKYFKFLNFWIDLPNFMETVQDCWNEDIKGNPMWRLQCKLKKLSRILSTWSRQNIGDVNDQVRDWEAKVELLEELDIMNNIDQGRENLNRGYAEYVRWLNLQDSLLRQKTQLKWFKDEEDGVQGDEKISKATIKHFKNQFNLNLIDKNSSIIECIPRIITTEDNNFLTKLPEEEEIKNVVFNMSMDSSAGPDGYNGRFFQVCWHIIKNDIVDFMQNFFEGKNLTRFYTHSCLALISKIDTSTSFSELRPISLSNFTNKIISKILAIRLNHFFPKLISENQSGFVTGRSITDNVMLTQEIIHGISKKNKGGNVVLKLDMAKSYDRLSWSFHTKVLNKFGFNDVWIDLIWRSIANAWYTIIINGTRQGFLKSSQGLKQGDPISPSLFIIVAEVLSRSLNSLLNNPNFTPFSMHKNGPQITHLAYADVFSSGNTRSLKLIMSLIKKYEKEGKKNIYFDSMVSKIVKRLNAWQGNMLSSGGRMVLIKSVIQSLPIYILFAINPPKGTLELIEKHIANFFWGTANGRNKYHWSAWENMCFPKSEVGIGTRSMSDVANTLTVKRWWKFREDKSLWADFLMAKYCPRMHLVGKKWVAGNSQAWKHLLWAREKSERYISWKINNGSCSFWWDNWTEIGPLAQICPNDMTRSDSKNKVHHYMEDHIWDVRKLYTSLPSQIVLHIISIDIGVEGRKDYAIWNNTEDGRFSNGSAWDLIRRQKANNDFLSKIWHRDIPFKMSFICWRMFLNKLPFPKSLMHNSNQERVDCACCYIPQHESMQHVLIEGQAAECIWNAMGAPLGITHQHLPINAIFRNWWNVKARNRVQRLVLNATPILIIWEIWKAWTACSELERLTQSVKCTIVCWIKPNIGMLKLNTDGSFFKDSNKAGIEGILRNEEGKMIMAYCMSVYCSSNNKAEALAVEYGVNWEANQVADFLAKQVATSGSMNFYHSYNELPREYRERMDKMEDHFWSAV